MVEIELGIVTADVDRLGAFYAALGFVDVARYSFPQGVVRRMRHGAAAIKLFAPVEGAAPYARPQPWHRDSGMRYAALHVDDIEATAERVRRAGGETLVDVTAHRPGARFALVADMEGNMWELLEERPADESAAERLPH